MAMSQSGLPATEGVNQPPVPVPSGLGCPHASWHDLLPARTRPHASHPPQYAPMCPTGCWGAGGTAVGLPGTCHGAGDAGMMPWGTTGRQAGTGLCCPGEPYVPPRLGHVSGGDTSPAGTCLQWAQAMRGCPREPWWGQAGGDQAWGPCRGTAAGSTVGAAAPSAASVHPTPSVPSIPRTHLPRSVPVVSSGAALSWREQRPRPQERAALGSTAGRLPIVPPLSCQRRERPLPPAAVGKW